MAIIAYVLMFITSAQVLVEPLTSLALLKTSCIGQTVKMKNKSFQPRLPHGGQRCRRGRGGSLSSLE